MSNGIVGGISQKENRPMYFIYSDTKELPQGRIGHWTGGLHRVNHVVCLAGLVLGASVHVNPLFHFDVCCMWGCTLGDTLS